MSNVSYQTYGIAKIYDAVSLQIGSTSQIYYPTMKLGSGKVVVQWQLSGGSFPDATTLINIRGRHGPDAPWTYITAAISNPASNTSGMIEITAMPEMQCYCAGTAASKTLTMWISG